MSARTRPTHTMGICVCLVPHNVGANGLIVGHGGLVPSPDWTFTIPSLNGTNDPRTGPNR